MRNYSEPICIDDSDIEEMNYESSDKRKFDEIHADPSEQLRLPMKEVFATKSKFDSRAVKRAIFYASDIQRVIPGMYMRSILKDPEWFNDDMEMTKKRAVESLRFSDMGLLEFNDKIVKVRFGVRSGGEWRVYVDYTFIRGNEQPTEQEKTLEWAVYWG